MKIVKTYSLYSIITIILAIVIMVLAWTFEKQNVEARVKEEYDRVFDRYKAILELKNNTLEKTTYDYSYWDDLVAFVDNKDEQWSTTNLLALEKTFGFIIFGREWNTSFLNPSKKFHWEKLLFYR